MTRRRHRQAPPLPSTPDGAVTYNDAALDLIELQAAVDGLQKKRALRHLPRRSISAVPAIFSGLSGEAAAAKPDASPRAKTVITFKEGPAPVCEATLPCAPGGESFGMHTFGPAYRCTEWRGHAGHHVTKHLPDVSAAMRSKISKDSRLHDLDVIAKGPAAAPAETPRPVYWGLAWEDGKPAKPIALPWAEMTAEEAGGAT